MARSGERLLQKPDGARKRVRVDGHPVHQRMALPTNWLMPAGLVQIPSWLCAYFMNPVSLAACG